LAALPSAAVPAAFVPMKLSWTIPAVAGLSNRIPSPLKRLMIRLRIVTDEPLTRKPSVGGAVGVWLPSISITGTPGAQPGCEPPSIVIGRVSVGRAEAGEI